jgi:hypothetical protein
VSGPRLMQLQREAFLRFYSRPSVAWNVTKQAFTNPAVLQAGITKIKRLSWRSTTYQFTPMYQRQQTAPV